MNLLSIRTKQVGHSQVISCLLLVWEAGFHLLLTIIKTFHFILFQALMVLPRLAHSVAEVILPLLVDPGFGLGAGSIMECSQVDLLCCPSWATSYHQYPRRLLGADWPLNLRHSGIIVWTGALEMLRLGSFRPFVCQVSSLIFAFQNKLMINS